MGIRYEKDTILNWINEMGKFLRLLTDKWEGLTDNVSEEPVHPERGYKDFFGLDRDSFLTISEPELEIYIASLEAEQIRPLAQLLLYDGLLTNDKSLLAKAKFLFETNMRQSGNFAFEDFDFLAKIETALK